MKRSRTAFLLVSASAALSALLTIGVARADNPRPPRSKTGRYSAYELQTIHAAEAELGATLDPNPEGKTVERVDYVTLDVIERRDPLPLFLNAVHVTTRAYVLEREMLFHVGEPFAKVVVDETARNLRGLPQLSLVLIVALRGSERNKVRVAVITKDVWSLRVSWDVLVTPGGLERLLLLPGEINVAGSHQTAQARFLYQPEAMTLGARYYVPRVFGTRIAASADVNVIVNRRSGKPEGSVGAFGVGQPLYSTRTKWSWGVNGGWRNEITRRYVNAAISTYVSPEAPSAGSVPYQWSTSTQSAEAYVTRSFGWAIKDDFTFGIEYSRRRYTTGDLSAYNPSVVDEFLRTRVPQSDTRSGPYLQYRAYSNDYIRVLDLETLGLQEDYRLGHDVYLRAQPVAKAFGASRTYLSTYAGAQYTVALGDGLVRGMAEASADLRTDGVPDSAVSGALRIVSPRTSVGRLVFDARYYDRLDNYLTRNTYLGGESRMRGFPSSYFVGTDSAVMNVEFRSRPIQLWSIQLGGAFFYDAGRVTSANAPRNVYQSVGFGFRFLFPQLDRTVFRGDLGFPIAPEGLPPGVAPVSFFATFDQAFGMPVVAP